jgi:hypothetical protein
MILLEILDSRWVVIVPAYYEGGQLDLTPLTEEVVKKAELPKSAINRGG